MKCYLQSLLHVMLFTVCATCNVISPVKHFCTLHQHFPQSVCSAQCGCFCIAFISCFIDMLLRYSLSDSSCPITTGLSLLLLLQHYPFSCRPVWTCLLIAPCRCARVCLTANVSLPSRSPVLLRGRDEGEQGSV